MNDLPPSGLMARLRAALFELALSVGETLSWQHEREVFAHGVMAQLRPKACGWLDDQGADLALPAHEATADVRAELGQPSAPEAPWLSGQRPNGDCLYAWPVQGHGRFFMASAEPFPAEALHELARLMRRVASALTACREQERLRQLSLAQRISDRAFELSPIAITVTDAEQRITEVNPAFCRVTGFSSDEVIGQTPRLFSSGHHDADFYRRMWQDIAQQGHWQGEIWNRRKNGEEYPELLTIIAVPDSVGVVRSYVAVFVDISEQKAQQAELERLRQDLQSSHDHLSAVLDNLGEGVYTLDAKGNCTYFNTRAQQILGWRADEVLGRNLHDLIHHHTPDGRELPEAQCPIRLAFTEQQIYHSEDEVFFHKNGTPIPVRAVGAPLFKQGRLVASVAVFDDISKQKKLEAELRAAIAAAEQLARMKSEFLSVMSHEIRTPLNGVIGAIDLLTGTPLDAEQTDYARTIRASAETLLAIINDILDFSKLEAGGVQLEALPTDLNQLARTALDIVRPLAKDKPVALVLSVPEPPPPAVLADSARLRQVLLNLLSNAVKFTAAGEVRLVVSVQASSDTAPGDAPARLRVCIEVHDSGVGMTTALQARLFRAFEQGDASVTRRYGGTGLGLAITKRLVDLMGGRIDVTSTPGQGSTFRVHLDLPIAASALPSTAPALAGVATATAAQSPAAATAPAASGPAHPLPTAAATPPGASPAALPVLLVEDNPVNQRVAARMLERLGCQVSVAANGEEALARFRESPVPLVFMDCQMPVMDGFAATAALREQTGGSRPPVVVALTANADESDRQRCLAAGMDDYLAKPITLDRLRDMLTRWAPTVAPSPPAAAPVSNLAVPETSAPPAPPLFDPVRVAAVFGPDTAFQREMATLFLLTAQSIFGRLEQALAHDPPEPAALSTLGHELKGSADNVGLTVFADVAERLSAQALAPDAQSLKRLRTELTQAIERLRHWLDQPL